MGKTFRVLTINPGSTSTKIAVFDNETKVTEQTLRHSNEELAPFKNITEQFDFRKNIILDCLKENNIATESFDAVVGRGGNLKPLASGTYVVNQAMLDVLTDKNTAQHAANLAAMIAYNISQQHNIPAFIVDPPSVDEMDDVARISGLPELPRKSRFHALNQKAIAKRAAKEMGKPYKELNMIVAHLGGGVSVGVHRKGLVIDTNNALNGDGPMTPERCGTLPTGDLIELCYSGKYTYDEMKKKTVGHGGLVGYLNTNDGREVGKMIEAGDENAKLVYRALAYQVAKEIGAGAAALKGDVDAICITGGLAYDSMLVGWIKEYVEFIAEVRVYPGEDELIALAQGALRILNNEEEAAEYK